MATKSTTVTTYDGQGNVVETRTATWETTPEQDNDEAIRDGVRNALQGNRAYLNLATPTAAQTTAQAKALTRQVNGLIRLTLGLLDGTD